MEIEQCTIQLSCKSNYIRNPRDPFSALECGVEAGYLEELFFVFAPSSHAPGQVPGRLNLFIVNCQALYHTSSLLSNFPFH